MSSENIIGSQDFRLPSRDLDPESTAPITFEDNEQYPILGDRTSGRYYWFGKIFFKCLVAETVFREADPSCSLTTIDADARAATSSFPISECLTRIDTDATLHKPHDLPEGFENPLVQLMTTIGAITAYSDGSTKRSLAEIVQRLALRKSGTPLRTDHFDTMPPNRLPPSPPRSDGSASRKTEFRRPVNRPSVEPSGRDIRQNAPAQTEHFMNQLHQWAQSNRMPIPTYSGHSFGEYNDWDQTCHVNGQQFRATAVTKKEARHQAAKQACLHFGIC